MPSKNWEDLGPGERRTRQMVLDLVEKEETVDSKDVGEALGVSANCASSHLRALAKEGLVMVDASERPYTYWSLEALAKRNAPDLEAFSTTELLEEVLRRAGKVDRVLKTLETL